MTVGLKNRTTATGRRVRSIGRRIQRGLALV